MATAVGIGEEQAARGFRWAQRELARSLDGGRASDDESSLESRRQSAAEPPRLSRAAPLEGPAVVARKVPGDPEVGFSAFLDGMQVSRVVLHSDALPIIHGTVAAVVRRRVDRRLGTWATTIEERLYAPRAFLSGNVNAALDASGITVVDTTPRKAGEADDEARHPHALSDVAVSAVQAHRESLELRLGESWIDAGSDPVMVDGSISASSRLAGSATAIGVLRNHRTLYGDAGAVRSILNLGANERSSVFGVESPNGWRSPVASWYLRVRAAADPLWGLVRVETRIPASDAERNALSARADQISRWILAEAAPLALPDSRWDTMTYGIRDCSQFLKATVR